jgi:lipoprotein signal peptidase
MVPLTALWLPILLSAIFVFIMSNILWMVLPFWHHGDYGRLPDEATVLGALKDAKSGQYIAPHVNWSKLTPEEREAHTQKPMAFMLVRNPAAFSMASALISWLVTLLVISILIAYVAASTLPPGTHYRAVFRVVGTAGILAYAFWTISDSIWYGKPWSVTLKFVIDGVIYGLLTAGTFGWLWPR